MPLIKSAKKVDIGKNIETEKHAHPDMSNAQAAAIAYSTARKAGANIPKSHRHKEHR